MNSMDTSHPTVFFLSLTILLYLFSHSWLGTGMCTSSHVMARRRSPLSLPCGTNDNQRILTNLIVCDRRRLSPIPASLLNIKSRLHAPRVVCKEVVFFLLFFLFFKLHSNVRPVPPSTPLQWFQCLWAGIGREG